MPDRCELRGSSFEEYEDIRPDADTAIVAALAALTAPSWLVTVAATWGSSPRPVGSLLVIDSTGRETGSVSGGCVESDLVALAMGGQLVTGPLPRRLIYGGEDAMRLGLPCGGRLELICERIDDPAPWRRLQSTLATGGLVERRVWLATGATTLTALSPETLPPADYRCDGQQLCRLFGPSWHLVIIGAEAIARELTPIARALGYRITLCDPRRERLAAFAGLGVARDTRMPDDCVAALADHPRAAVVALTHDPRLDDMALMQALISRAFYIGALGSQHTQAARRVRLATLGLSPANIARLHGPVGLDLGGKTPAEIAVAIAAELVACRHRRPPAAHAGGGTG